MERRWFALLVVGFVGVTRLAVNFTSREKKDEGRVGGELVDEIDKQNKDAGRLPLPPTSEVDLIDQGTGTNDGQKSRSDAAKRGKKHAGGGKVKNNPGSDADGQQPSPLFHQVLTTGTKYLSTINVRSIESVFYVYPNARLHLHYNKKSDIDINNKRLRPLLAEGYNIKLLPYDPAKQLRLAAKLSARRDKKVNNTLAQEYINNIKPRYSKERFWFSNEANLLRLCLLYTVGGTYLDTDVILIKPLDDFDNAVAGSKGKSIHCAVLRFTKPGNTYLAAAINNFMEHYDGERWGNNGPSAFRRTAQDHLEMVCPGEVGLARKVEATKEGRCYVNILPASTFAPVGWRDWEDICSRPEKSPVDDEARALLKHSYAVHLNNQITGPLFSKVGYVKGSVCHMVLTQYCKVCS